MGSGAISCCYSSSSKASEFTLNSPHYHQSSPYTLRELSHSTSLPLASNVNFHAISNIKPRIRALKALSQYTYLSLKIVNSLNLSSEVELLIYPTGLMNSSREQEDGYTFFGSKKKVNGEIANDYVLPIADKAEAESHRGQHFVISYNIEEDSYWVKDLARGFGVFSRLDFALTVKDNMLLNIGESFLVLNMNENSVLSLKLFSGNISDVVW